jgi:hypothetical protein
MSSLTLDLMLSSESLRVSLLIDMEHSVSPRLSIIALCGVITLL